MYLGVHWGLHPDFVLGGKKDCQSATYWLLVFEPPQSDKEEYQPESEQHEDAG